MTSTPPIDATTSSQNEKDAFASGDDPRLQTAPTAAPSSPPAWPRIRETLLVAGSPGFSAISYWVFSTRPVLLWMCSLLLLDSRSQRIILTGSTGYVRVARASFGVFGVIAIVAFLTQIEVGRGYLLLGLPVGVIVLVFTRWLWRQWIILHRCAEAYSARVLLVGSETSVVTIANELRRPADAGYKFIGACTPSGEVPGTIPGTDIPVMGSVNKIEVALAVTSRSDLPTGKVNQVSWALEACRQRLAKRRCDEISSMLTHERADSGTTSHSALAHRMHAVIRKYGIPTCGGRATYAEPNLDIKQRPVTGAAYSLRRQPLSPWPDDVSVLFSSWTSTPDLL